MNQVDFAAVNRAALPRLPEILRDLLPDGRRQGHEFVALNPNRSDRKPGSFTINLNTGRWSDFATREAGGDPVSLVAFVKGVNQVEAARDLADRIGMSESSYHVNGNANGHAARPADDWEPIIPVPADAPKLTDAFVRRLAPNGFELGDGHWYHTADGSIVGVVARYVGQQDGQSAKTFRPFMFCRGPHGRREWRCKGFPSPRPLYGLHLLAERSEAPVLVLEGERTVAAADALFKSHIATTSLNGSQSPTKTDWSPLAGREVVIWPDADAAGTHYAAVVTDRLRQVGAKSIRIIELPAGLPAGWDLADDLPESLTKADLVRLLAVAKLVDGSTGSTASANEPLPLFPEMPPAEPYPVDALGPVLFRAAAAIARKIQCPTAIGAQSVLAAAAIAAQAHADVRLPFGQARPLSIFMVTVARSGDRKSSADNEASWPISKREKALREDNVESMKAWRIEQSAWAAQKRKIEADAKSDFQTRKERLTELGEEPPRPLSPFLTSGDLTIEGLTKNWPNAHAALGVFSAEAGQFTAGHAMGDDAKLRTAAVLSELWDGKNVKRVRATDGISILSGRRLSMHLLVQPDAAAEFLANPTLRDQGLLSRVLVAAPDSLAGTRLYRDPDPADDASIQAFGARILSILETDPPLVEGTQNELVPRVLTIGADAVKLWRELFDHIEAQTGGDLRCIVDLASKAAEHAARIAGVLTIIHDIRATEIGAAAMANAITLVDWYLNEALRLHAGSRMDPKLVVSQELFDWLAAQPGDVDFRDILRLGPNRLRIKAEADAALRVLIEHGWVIEISTRPRRFRVIRSGAS